jgi:hypothetical protein
MTQDTPGRRTSVGGVPSRPPAGRAGSSSASAAPRIALKSTSRASSANLPANGRRLAVVVQVAVAQPTKLGGFRRGRFPHSYIGRQGSAPSRTRGASPRATANTPCGLDRPNNNRPGETPRPVIWRLVAPVLVSRANSLRPPSQARDAAASGRTQPATAPCLCIPAEEKRVSTRASPRTSHSPRAQPASQRGRRPAGAPACRRSDRPRSMA